jgi:hypothetical protein
MTARKISRRGRIISLLTFSNTDQEILSILDKEFPAGVFKTSNKKALYGTKWDLDLVRKKEHS